VPYVWFMTKQPAQFSRWVYPLTPIVAVGGAVAVIAVAEWLARRGRASAPATARAWRAAAIAVVLVAVIPPVWLGARQFSRRLTPPTHALAEAWLAARVAPTDQVLSQYHWLDLTGLPGRINRVGDLPAVLAGGDYEIYANNWVVIPEIYFGDPNLDRLALAQQFAADQGFGGNRGIDFRIYTPKPVALVPPVDIDLGASLGRAFLGTAWSREPSSYPGRELPAGGADLCVPPASDSDARLVVEFATSYQVTAADEPPIRVSIEGTDVEMRMLVTAPQRVQLASGVLPAARLARRIIRISLAPTDPDAGVIRVLRFTLR
jgi:hypothetical protein